MEIPGRHIDEAWKRSVAKSKDQDGNTKSLYEHTKEVIECACILWRLGYISNFQELELLLEACQYHDAGKLTEDFNRRVCSEKRIPFNDQQEIPHSLLSVFAVPFKKYDKESFYILAYAIMHHHPRFQIYRLYTEGGA